MKLGLMFGSAAFTTAEDCHRMVEIAEDVGVESVWAVEHVLAPSRVESRYPYSDDGRAAVGEAVLLDPVVWLSFVASVSRTLRLGSGVLILPQRHPAYVAKEWATLDRLSNGRAMLGIGVGWLKEEMEALGLPFHKRGARTDECIRAIRSLWADGASTFQGRFFEWSEMVSLPKPVQRPGVPIIVGGHSIQAARRAARLGDGFFSVGTLSGHTRTQPGQLTLEAALDAIEEECREVGRDPTTIEISVGANRPTTNQIRQLVDLGVSRVLIAPTRPSRLRQMLESVMSVVGGG